MSSRATTSTEAAADQPAQGARQPGGRPSPPTPPAPRPQQPKVPEIGGPTGPEPTRYGDWEKGGRCTDF